MKPDRTMLFPEEFINQVREENDIVDVISNYIPLKKGGANYKGLCPFHSEKTPSFMVSPSKQIFHCFGCGEGGNVFNFLMKHENMGFPDAVRDLAERCGRPVPETRPSSQDAAQQKVKARIYEMNTRAQEFFAQKREETSRIQTYLKNREVSKDSVNHFGIGYAPDSWDALYLHLKGFGFLDKEMEQAGLILQKKSGEGYYDRFRDRVMFPIIDLYDRALGFGGRVLDDATPKYLNSPETPVFSKGSNLYGLNRSHEAIRKQDYAILVEGYMDVIMAHQNGIRNIVATLGTALTQGHLRRLRRYTRNLALFFDSDEAGLKAAERSFDLCVPEGMKIKVVTLPRGEDPDSFLRKQGKNGFSEKMATALPIMDFMIGQIMGEAPPKGLEEKVTVADRLTPFLSIIPNPVEQELYVKKSASLLGINAESLGATIGPGLAKNRKKRDALFKMKERTMNQDRASEGKFVGLLINHPNLISDLKEKVHIDYFRDPGMQSLVERILSLPEEQCNSRSLHALIPPEDTSLTGLLSEFTIKEQATLDIQAEAQGYIESLRLKYLKGTKTKLREDAKIAEEQGKDKEVSKLMESIKALDLEVEALQQKRGSEGRNIIE